MAWQADQRGRDHEYPWGGANMNKDVNVHVNRNMNANVNVNRNVNANVNVNRNVNVT